MVRIHQGPLTLSVLCVLVGFHFRRIDSHRGQNRLHRRCYRLPLLLDEMSSGSASTDFPSRAPPFALEIARPAWRSTSPWTIRFGENIWKPFLDSRAARL